MLCLSTTQEEADTKVFLCAKHAALQGSESICIETVDTDIVVYALFFNDKIPVRMYINFTVSSRRRIIDIDSIADELGLACCSALPALHSFTGNDYTSAFYGCGKSKAFKLVKSDESFQETFSKFGDTFDFNADLFENIECFVSRLYGSKANNVNEARYNKFCSSKKKIPEPQKLPPTRDALLQHCKRVSYVTAIIKSSLENSPTIPDPEGYGWKLEDGKMIVDWILLPMAPADVLIQISCNCKKTRCRTQACECKSHGLQCTDLCGCVSCNNDHEDSSSESEDEDDQDESSEDEID